MLLTRYVAMVLAMERDAGEYGEDRGHGQNSSDFVRYLLLEIEVFVKSYSGRKVNSIGMNVEKQEE